MFQATNQMCVFLKHSDCTIGINWTRGILEERSIKKKTLVNVNSLRTGKSSSIIYKFGKSTNFLWAMASMSQTVSLYQRVNPIRSLLNHHKITIFLVVKSPFSLLTRHLFFLLGVSAKHFRELVSLAASGRHPRIRNTGNTYLSVIFMLISLYIPIKTCHL